MKNKKPDILSKKTVASSRLFQVEALQLRFSNGAERSYERMAAPDRDAVMVVPITERDTTILIREYAAGTHDYEVGFPKGVIDAGETPEQAANRELMEEVGYGAKQLVLLKTVIMSPAYFGGRMHLYLAYDLYQQRLTGDEPESLQPFEVPFTEFDSLLATELHEARSITALLLAQRWLAQNG